MMGYTQSTVNYYAFVSLVLFAIMRFSTVNTTDCAFEFTGPSDDVFIMDRSKSLSPQQFNRMKEAIEEIVKYFFKLRADHNRIAVVAYNAEATVLLDHISHDKGVKECELFLHGGPWETDVVFDPATDASPRGQLFDAAFEKATNILRTSDRESSTNVASRVWIFSDLETDTDLPISNIDNSLPNLQIYGFGIGGRLHMPNFYQMVTDECALNETQWIMKLQELIDSGKGVPKPDGSYVSVKDSRLCDDCEFGCQCLEFNQGDTPKCSDKPKPEGNDNKESFLDRFRYWIIIGVAGGLILISIIIITCACVTRRRRKQKEELKMRKFMAPMNGMPEPSPFTVTIPTSPTPPNHPDVVPVYRPQPIDDEDLYENGTFQKDLISHGVEFKNSNKSNNIDQQKTRGNPEPPKTGKYVKNQKSIEQKVPSRFNNTPAPKPGHSRTISDVSVASSAPSYMAPIPDSECGGYSRQASGLDYSYPYMDIPLNNRNGVWHTTGKGGSEHYDDSRSPPSGKYEQCTFPQPKKTKRAKKDVESASNSTELLDKISNHKHLLRPISKQLSFKTQSAKETPSTQQQHIVKQKATTLNIENSARDYVNIQEPKEHPEKSNARDQKRSSKKLGTVKFNAIKAKLESEKQNNGSQQDVAKFSNVL